jgi:hypothetical protein
MSTSGGRLAFGPARVGFPAERLAIATAAMMTQRIAALCIMQFSVPFAAFLKLANLPFRTDAEHGTRFVLYRLGAEQRQTLAPLLAMISRVPKGASSSASA